MTQQSIFDSLREKDAAAWLEYLRPFEETGTAPGMSTDLVLDSIVGRAKEQTNLEWAEVIVRFLDLAARLNGGAVRDYESFRAMNLRAWFIAKMGSRSGHLLLDQAPVIAWVKESLTVTPAEAAEKARWFRAQMGGVAMPVDPEEKHRLVETARALRRMKHRLGVAEVLAEAGELEGEATLDEWLAMRDELP